MGKIAKKNIPKVENKNVDITIKKSVDKKLVKKKPKTVVSAQLEKRLGKAKRKYKKPERGVVLIRQLPHGFFEEQIRNYFQQFGHITRLRLARSRKTGGPKGFAFIEFAVPEVAKIAAETMDNYLMFQKIVKSHYIPPNEQKFNYFKTNVRCVTTETGKQTFTSNKKKAIRKKVKENNKWTDDAYLKRTKNTLTKLNKLKEKCSTLGINLDDITVAPTLVPYENKDSENENDELNTTQEDIDENQPGSLLLIKKRKTNDHKKLKDLMENTFEDDSSADEDYLPDSLVNENDSEESDQTDSESIKLHSNNESEEEEIPVEKVVRTKNFAKPIKPQKMDRLEHIIRRTPHLGGIQKFKKKALNKLPPKNVKMTKKKQMQSVAAKDIIKTDGVKIMKKPNLKKKKQN